MRKFKSFVLLALVGIGIAGTLGGCIIEDERGGHWHHHDWR